MKEKIFSGLYIRVRLRKYLNNYEEQYEHLVLCQDTVIENEARSQVTELKLNGTRALIQQRHFTQAQHFLRSVLKISFGSDVVMPFIVWFNSLVNELLTP